MTLEIKRLFEEFRAQNCCSTAIAQVGGRDVVVAMWSEAGKTWGLTPEGSALLSAPVEVQSADTLASKPKQKRGKKAEAEPNDELNLDDI